MADSSDAVIIDITAKFTDQTSPAIEGAQRKLSGFMETVQKLQAAWDRLNSGTGSAAAFDKAQASADKFDSSAQKAVSDVDKLGQTKTSDTMFSGAESGANKFTQAVEKSKNSVNSLNRTRAQPTLSVRDVASRVIKDVGNSIHTIAGKTFSFTVKALDLATKPIRSIFDFATSLKGILTGIATGVAVKGTILDPISLADQYKNAEIGFETMLGSVQKGQQMMNSIQKFAIATPFSTSDVVTNTQTMMAYGFQAKDVINDMKIIGDQAAATGRGAEGLNQISLALGQMQAHGKVDAQDMNQLTSAGVKGWDYLAQSMGKTKAQVMDMSEKGLIPASAGVQAILKGMQEYNGMMDKMANSTATGLLSQIKDTFSINILTKWGQGLQKGVVGGLSKFSDWLGKNQDKIAKWGDALEAVGATISQKVTSKVEALGDRINGVVNSDAFQKAGTLSDKIHILWDQVIVVPFDNWWSSGGKKWLSDKAAGIGRGLGSALTGGLLALLGITNPGAADSGASIGGAFAKGFSETFNGKKIGETFIKDLKSIISDAGKLLPGGQSADSTSWLSAALLGYLGIKGISGAAKVGKGVAGAAKGISTIKGMFSKAGGAAAAEEGTEAVATDTMMVNATVVNVTGKVVNGGNGNNLSKVENALNDFAAAKGGAQVGKMLAGSTAAGAAGRLLTGASETRLALPASTALEKGADLSFVDKIFAEGPGTASKLGKAAEVFGKVGKAAPVIGTALAVAGGAMEVAAAPKGQKARTAAGAGGSIAGGFAGAEAGAQLGAMAGGAIGSVVPGAGNAVGAAIGGGVGAVAGGVAGAIGGEKAAKAIYDKKDDIGKGLSTAGKAMGNFFTKTLPSAASSAAKTAGTFITKTVPGAASKLGKSAGKFFSDLPHQAVKGIGMAAGSVQKFATRTAPAIGKSVGNFFTSTLPKAAGKVASTAGTFVTKTIPKAASTAGNAVGGFFTKTLPSAASKVAGTVGTFVTKTVPGAAQTAGNAVGGFFTKTLPSAASKAASTVGNFVTKTVPGAAQTAGNAVGGFFTKTLPDAATQAATGIGNFVTKTIPGAVGTVAGIVGGFFTKTLPNAVSSFFSNIGKHLQGGWDTVKGWFMEGYNQTSAHATGGIFSKPHVGLVAEAGPEAIIPLSRARRARGMALWQQAGSALGVHQYADGGIVGGLAPVIPIAAARRASAETITPGVKITIEKIEFTGSSGSNGVPSDSDKEQLANELALRTAKALEKIFPNIPLGA